MQNCNLTSGDPLQLTIAADARLIPPDYLNDHIWEMDLSGGDPSALGLRTTYGLRARLMRIFPRFIEKFRQYLPEFFKIQVLYYKLNWQRRS